MRVIKELDNGKVLVKNKNGVKFKRQRMECRTRVLGYHRPVQAYNKGKKSEYYSRKNFKEEEKSLNNKFNKKYE